MNKILIFILTSLYLSISYSQEVLYKGTSINIDNAPPHVLSVLDITSDRKGLLIPRVTYAEMLAILNPVDYSAANPNPDDNALIVYVTEPAEYEDFWYWADTRWNRLHMVDEPDFYGDIPIGGIIMYSGNIADIPDNWKICNGENGTPDLRGRFVVGKSTTQQQANTDTYEQFDPNVIHHPDLRDLESYGGTEEELLTENTSIVRPHNDHAPNKIELNRNSDGSLDLSIQIIPASSGIKLHTRPQGTDSDYYNNNVIIRSSVDNLVDKIDDDNRQIQDNIHSHDISFTGSVTITPETGICEEVEPVSHNNIPLFYTLIYIQRIE